MSSSQLFKEKIPKEMLFSLLDAISEKTLSYYCITLDSYKRGNYYNLITPFINQCKPYYHLSKQLKYLEKKMTYHRWITILRQICHAHQLSITSSIVYDKSTYTTVYHLFFQ